MKLKSIDYIIIDLVSMSERSSKRKRKEPTNNMEPIVEIGFQIDILADDATIKAFEEQFKECTVSHSDDKEDASLNNLIREVILKRSYLNSVSQSADIFDQYIMKDGESSFPRVGDKVRASYVPLSQKYIEYYDSQLFIGEVFFVDPERNNFFMWNVETSPISSDGKINLTYRVRSFKRQGCHYFGMADCYYSYYTIL